MPKGKASSHLMPAVGYLECLNRFLVTLDGQVVTVASCTAADFSAMVQASAATAPKENQEALTNALSSLDYQHALDKWNACLQLIHYNVPLQLYRLKAEAAVASRLKGTDHDNSRSTPPSAKAE